MIATEVTPHGSQYLQAKKRFTKNRKKKRKEKEKSSPMGQEIHTAKISTYNYGIHTYTATKATMYKVSILAPLSETIRYRPEGLGRLILIDSFTSQNTETIIHELLFQCSG